MTKFFSVLALVAAFAAPAFAAPQTVTLAVQGMTCAACPITVKQSLKKVNGVLKTDVSFEKKHAVVSFDDQKTNVQALTRATTDAGFPSTVKP
ncbi:MAG: mercury resistance system periplasmic binding protein MerP [Ramlibacter sp.]|nr:mercury resistance system periplasmic binding protein MerP [Ramlibacter sp.]